MKEKIEKEAFLVKVFRELSKSSENNSILFDEREKLILSYFPSFIKEGIKFLEPIFIVDNCFTDIENFDFEYNKKIIRCFLVEVNDRTSSGWCIKASKITHPGRTLFLGMKGINILRKRFPEKIVGKNVYTFDCKRSATPNDIPGINLQRNNYYTTKFLKHPGTIGGGNVIAIFKEKEIPE